MNSADARTSLFGRLAMESGLVAYEDVVAGIEEQEKNRTGGRPHKRLGEIFQEKGLLTREEVETLLRLQMNPSGLVGRRLVEKGLLTPEQVRECLNEQVDRHRRGLPLPRLEEIAVSKGFLKAEEVPAPPPAIQTTARLSEDFSEFLAVNRLVNQVDIDKCLALQKEGVARGEPRRRVGELLVEIGALRRDLMELYTQRFLQSRRRGLLPARATSTAPVGSVVRGEFAILDTLGRHWDGMTCKAMHLPSGAVVAAHFFSDPELGEGKTAARNPEAFARKCAQTVLLRHYAVQQVIACEETDSGRVLTAEYVDGASLAAVLASKGAIPWHWAAEMAFDFASALEQAAGLGLFHDDIRPGSILVNLDGKARLGQWSYTEDPIAGRDWIARQKGPLPYYFAPERLTRPASEKTDMFSLGAVLVNALGGKPPMQGASFAEAAGKYSRDVVLRDLAMNLDIPIGMLSILSRLMDADPDNRFENYAALVRALETFSAEQSLVFKKGRTLVAFSRDISPKEAANDLAAFLSRPEGLRPIPNVSFRRLLRMFAGPLVAMLLLAVGTTALYRMTQSSKALEARANRLDAAGDKAGALALYHLLSAIHPLDGVIQQRYYDLGMEVKDYGEVETALEHLMLISPDRRNAYLEQQADVRVWQQRFGAAVELYREAIAGRPGDLGLMGKLANALLWAKDYPGAEKAFAELQALAPGNYDATLGLARAAAGAGDSERAIAMYQKLAETSPLSETLVMEYAWALQNAGQAGNLVDFAKKTLADRAAAEYSQRDKAFLSYWAGDYASAIKILDELIAATPENKELLQVRIGINDQAGKIDAVIADYQTLVRLEPDKREYDLTLARLFQQKKDFIAADGFLRQALATNPEDLDVKVAIAENLGYMGKHADAIVWYREVLAKRPNDENLLREVVQSMLWSGDFVDAKDFVERLYKENPSDKTNRLHMAIVYANTGNPELAKPIIDALIRDNVLAAADMELLAGDVQRAGDDVLLMRVIGSAAGDSPRIAEMRLFLARRLRAAGRHDASLPLYAAALAANPAPDPKLLVEMAESAEWSGHPDIAVIWLEAARDAIRTRDGGRGALASGKRFRLTRAEWNVILDPLKRSPDAYEALAGLPNLFASDAVPRAL